MASFHPRVTPSLILECNQLTVDELRNYISPNQQTPHEETKDNLIIQYANIVAEGLHIASDSESNYASTHSVSSSDHEGRSDFNNHSVSSSEHEGRSNSNNASDYVQNDYHSSAHPSERRAESDDTSSITSHSTSESESDLSEPEPSSPSSIKGKYSIMKTSKNCQQAMVRAIVAKIRTRFDPGTLTDSAIALGITGRIGPADFCISRMIPKDYATKSQKNKMKVGGVFLSIQEDTNQLPSNPRIQIPLYFQLMQECRPVKEQLEIRGASRAADKLLSSNAPSEHCLNVFNKARQTMVFSGSWEGDNDKYGSFRFRNIHQDINLALEAMTIISLMQQSHKRKRDLDKHDKNKKGELSQRQQEYKRITNEGICYKWYQGKCSNKACLHRHSMTKDTSSSTASTSGNRGTQK
eukprot:CAMPEP_0204843658 /NCGR_PEP_ID=MMETSP1346-20131115/48109_1 /ASSEMBLY_ACC=CAM_ASM_000771 /TAXON_ID=215587 /ORGANISM="Aplanochytrium stocchinoi, Strain GSBS06" /LENGTH=409 /DNA_ID=CAMNT_0051982841 /DNA_START=527 /DNA_END=1757 /DNA_ORIENTATION=-